MTDTEILDWMQQNVTAIHEDINERMTVTWLTTEGDNLRDCVRVAAADNRSRKDAPTVQVPGEEPPGPQDKVCSRYPHARAEQESTGEWWDVWDMSHDELRRLNEARWPEVYGRRLVGLGKTEAEAWADAARAIELREGRRLPVPSANRSRQ